MIIEKAVKIFSIPDKTFLKNGILLCILRAHVNKILYIYLNVNIREVPTKTHALWIWTRYFLCLCFFLFFGRVGDWVIDHNSSSCSTDNLTNKSTNSFSFIYLFTRYFASTTYFTSLSLSLSSQFHKPYSFYILFIIHNWTSNEFHWKRQRERKFKRSTRSFMDFFFFFWLNPSWTFSRLK